MLSLNYYTPCFCWTPKVADIQSIVNILIFLVAKLLGNLVGFGQGAKPSW